MAEPAPGSLGFWAKCRSCKHCWIVAFYPMQLDKFARILKQAKLCPKCGAPHPTTAKQDAGVLQEPAA